MISNLVILVFSLVLFIYWLRYNCVLILKSKPAPDSAARIAVANNLGFVKVQEHLKTEPRRDELLLLHEWLVRDYRILTSLLRYSSVFESRNAAAQQRILRLDFKLMQLWFALMRKPAPSQARRTLSEMARILNHFAAELGERSEAAFRN